MLIKFVFVKVKVTCLLLFTELKICCHSNASRLPRLQSLKTNLVTAQQKLRQVGILNLLIGFFISNSFGDLCKNRIGTCLVEYFLDICEQVVTI